MWFFQRKHCKIYSVILLIVSFVSLVIHPLACTFCLIGPWEIEVVLNAGVFYLRSLRPPQTHFSDVKFFRVFSQIFWLQINYFACSKSIRGHVVFFAVLIVYGAHSIDSSYHIIHKDNADFLVYDLNSFNSWWLFSSLHEQWVPERHEYKSVSSATSHNAIFQPLPFAGEFPPQLTVSSL